MIDHAPCVDFTVPLGWAAKACATHSEAARKTPFAKVLESQGFMTAPFPNHGTLSRVMPEEKDEPSVNWGRLRQ
jgi:hypothetical protein